MSDQTLLAAIDAILGDRDRLQRGETHVGLDLEDVESFGTLLTSSMGSAFVHRSFTDHERKYCGDDPVRFAGRWAVKEAVVKAIGTGFRGITPAEIEVVHRDTGGIDVRSVDGGEWPLRSDLWEWHASLSHEGNAVIAITLAIGQEEGVRQNHDR